MIPKIYSVGGQGVLRVCHTDKFKAGQLSFSMVLPIERETFFLNSLLFSVLCRGSVSLPSMAAINLRLDYLYSTDLSVRNSRHGDFQCLGFSADVLNPSCLPKGENLTREVLSLMQELIFHPLLDENGLLVARYVESEKKQLCDSLRSLKNNPRMYALDRCTQIVYADHPCGAPLYASEEKVMAVTPAQLTAYWKELIANAVPDFFYVGGEDEPLLLEAVSDTLCQGFSAERRSQASVSRRFSAGDAVKRVDETLEVTQSQLVMALATDTTIDDEDYYACMVFNEMLGASPVSKLFVNVREKLSLCYFCYSRYYSLKGAILIQCGLAADNRARAEEEILTQLRALADGDFSNEELSAAKNSLVSMFRQVEDSAVAIENYFYSRSMAGHEIPLEQMREAISRITREELIAVAKKVKLDTVYFLEGTLPGEEGDENEDD